MTRKGKAWVLIPAFMLAFSWHVTTAEDKAPADWVSQVTEDIRRSEYHFTGERDGAFSAPNRLHDLRSRISASGVSVESRVDPGAWRLEMRLLGQGRGDSLSLHDGSVPQAVTNRVEILWKGLVEWYVNDERGLEQGFTINDPPPGRGTGRPVRIALALGGDLSPVLASDRRSVTFRNSAGVDVVHYRDLVVVDALGNELKAEIHLDPGRLVIRYDDREARYPVTIDPLLTTPSWTVEMDVSGAAHLGVSVSTAGDINSDGRSDVVVGADGYDASGTDSGLMRIYLGEASAAGLATSPSFTWTGSLVGARFGSSVGTAGDVNGDGFGDVIVSEPNYHGAGDQRGRVHVFLGNASGQSLVRDWYGDGDQDFGHFGASVATAGDVNQDGYSDIVIGAPDSDQVEGDNRGMAFAWFGSASGLGTPGLPSNADWTAVGDQDQTVFGRSVATAGDVNADGYSDVIVGAPLHDNNGGIEVDGGKAYIYLGSASGVAASAIWSADPFQTMAQFGNSVATAGDVNGDGYADVIVGAVEGSEPTFTASGRAFVYYGSPSGPSVIYDWNAGGGQNNAHLGASVATAGDVNGDGYADIVVGAKTYNSGQPTEGKVFAWYGGAGGLGANGTPTNADWSAENNVNNANFGASVATAGDVNGDGYSDVIVGSPWFESSGGQTDEGKVFLYKGSGDGLLAASTPRLTLTGTQSASNFATSVASAGDVNGDGFSDVVIGAPNFDNGTSDTGRAYVFHGSASGLSGSATWVDDGSWTGGKFGISVAAAGDVNGDGFGDLIVGAPYHTNSEGRAYVYFGSNMGLGANPDWTGTSSTCCSTTGQLFGYSVASAGDFNGDGFGDVIVGAPRKTVYRGLDEGAAQIFYGSTTGPATSPSYTVAGDHICAQLGYSVASAGDVNRDGKSDVIIGAPYWHNSTFGDCGNPSSNAGRVFVFHGSGQAPPISTVPPGNWQVTSNQDGSGVGIAVASAGDVNGDGYSDVIIGAPTFQNPSGDADEGHAFVWYGGSAGVTPNPGIANGSNTNAPWHTESNDPGARYGASVSSAGDINNDGFSDVVVGAPLFDSPDSQTNEGRVSVFLSTGSGLSTTGVNFESNTVNANLGSAVALAGDVNGDGFSDLLFGAPGIGSGLGQAYLYSSSGGLTRIARQSRSTGNSPIGPLGKTYDSGTSFNLRLDARTPAGRGPVAIQWETETIAIPFDGLGLGQTFFYDSGAPQAVVGSRIDLGATQYSLTLGTSYHWRARSITKSPFFPRSPWFSLPHNNVTEKDLIALAGAPPPPPPPCGPCLVSYCAGGGFRCEWTDTCGGGGCCIYDCSIPDPTCELPDMCPDDPPIACNCSGGGQ